MNKTINEIDVVALTQDLPELGLNKGETGTVVDKSESGVFLVEFSNENGEMIALESLKIEQIVNTFAKIKACKNFGKTRKIPHT